jgi:hypothetical protein
MCRVHSQARSVVLIVCVPALSRHLVLDEVDSMLGMGLEPHIRRIVQRQGAGSLSPSVIVTISCRARAPVISAA